MIIGEADTIASSVFGGPLIVVDSPNDGCITIEKTQWVCVDITTKSVWGKVNPDIYCPPVSETDPNSSIDWIFINGKLASDGILTAEGIITSD